MDSWKSRSGKSQRGEEKKKEDQRGESEKKEEAGARKGRKVAIHCVFPMFCGSGGSEVGSLKRRMRSHVVRWEIKNCRCGAKHISKAKCTKHRVSDFESWDVAKVHMSKSKCTKTSRSDHFRKLRCRKNARRCGAKHISKATCIKHRVSGHFWNLRCCKMHPLWGEAHVQVKMHKKPHVRTLLEVEMSQKCTSLWGEAHFHRKMYKAHSRTTFGSWDVEKVHAAVARGTFPSQKCKKMTGSDHFWRFRCRFAWQVQGIVHLVKSEQKVKVLCKVQLQLQRQYVTRHYTTLYFTAQYSTTHHYTTPEKWEPFFWIARWCRFWSDHVSCDTVMDNDGYLQKSYSDYCMWGPELGLDSRGKTWAWSRAKVRLIMSRQFDRHFLRLGSRYCCW